MIDEVFGIFQLGGTFYRLCINNLRKFWPTAHRMALWASPSTPFSQFRLSLPSFFMCPIMASIAERCLRPLRCFGVLLRVLRCITLISSNSVSGGNRCLPR